MDRQDCNFDKLGNTIGQRYTKEGINLNHEKVLKAFDENLELFFDKFDMRFVILEWSYTGDGFNRIMTLEDDNKNPKEFGDWVMNQLFVWRTRWLASEHKRRVGANFLESLIYEADLQKAKIENSIKDDNINMLKDDINDIRRAMKEEQNLPTSDVTAGYQLKGK